MASNLLEDSVGDIIDTAFADVDDELLVIDPSAETIEAIVEAGIAAADLPEIRLIAAERSLKDAMDDFLVASKAADLVADGTLSLYVLESGAENSLFVSQESVVALVSVGDRVAALQTDDEGFIEEVYDAYRETIEGADAYNLRTPPISRVRETMDEEIGEESRADFDSVLDSMETARGNGDGLDEVTVSLLVAAKNEVLLYDISKWGEDVGIASKATFSRTKTRLEDHGLIDTEKVPIDVGRPRLRLKLGHEELIGVPADELAATVQRLLEAE